MSFVEYLCVYDDAILYMSYGVRSVHCEMQANKTYLTVLQQLQFISDG